MGTPQEHAILRIIDANLNRLGEGLRLLEEVARFVLDDGRLTAELKDLRHRLAPKDEAAKKRYLSARESEADVGPGIKPSYQQKPRELVETVVANARRTQESLRVLEELSKTPNTGLQSDEYSQARFRLYTVEKELVGRLLRQDRTKRIRGLYVIVDTASLKGKSHSEVTSEILAGGCRLIQLRGKNTCKKDLLSIAIDMKRLCAEHDALFIVNDHLDITLACDADGLHIGQDDMPVAMARRLLPVGSLIGCSVENLAQARQAQSDGADYIACGAVYATPTKEGCGVVGCQMLRDIKREVKLPLVAIGGINENNIAEVIEAGADSVAVISAVLSAGSVEEATRRLIQKLEECHEGAD